MSYALPPEVIRIILSELVDDLTTLLNCRLVCHSWNAQSLALLRRSKFRKELRPSDLEKALHFVPQDGQFILPFRLKYVLRQRKPETPCEFECKCLHEFHTMKYDVARLFEMCGPACLPEFDMIFYSGGSRALAALNEFLSKISINLKTFYLYFSPSDSLGWRETVEILRKDPVLFPNLKKLTCYSSTFSSPDHDQGHPDFPDQENIESVLIENSHNLETLILGTAGGEGTSSVFDFNFWPTTTKHPPAALKTLKSLDGDVIGNRLQFLHSLRASPFAPILQVFEFSTTSCRPAEISAMEEILLLFSKTLKKICVTLSPVCWSESVAFPLKFPRLPQLEHLCLRNDRMCGLTCVDTLKFKFSQETFPNLRSVQIPFGCMIVPVAELQQSLQKGSLLATTFPTVHELTFEVEKQTFRQKIGFDWNLAEDCDDYGDGDDQLPSIEQISPQTYLDLVSRTFPAVTTVTVYGSYKTATARDNVAFAIGEIIESSRLGPAIETFEIQSSDAKANFRNMLEAAVLPNSLTPNLRKLRIWCSKSRYGESESRSYRSASASGAAIYSPILPKEGAPGGIQEIEICSELMGESHAERLEMIRFVRTKFPTWKVRLI